MSTKTSQSVIILFVFVLGWVTWTQPSSAQEDLPDAVQQGLNQITQVDVQATISFLASDEMAGRETPSRELDIASAYVASRFASAGLKPGVEGSFFQRHKVATSALPSASVTFQVDGQPAQHFGAFSAGAEDFEFSGAVTAVELKEDLGEQKFEGAVLIKVPELQNPREQFMFRRELAQFKRRGAACILLQVTADNQAVASAQRATHPRLVNPRAGSILPTLLVAEFDPSKPVHLTIPKQQNGSAEVRNVIGILPGSDEQLSKQAIIFSAHLDHVGSQPGLPDPVFNGADDNATGVTSVIQLARAFGAMPERPKRTLIFMTFWGEEKGLLGSKRYVSEPTWPLDKIVANVNIEMVGRPEAGAAEKVWMTGWNQSDLGKLMAESSEKIGVQIFEHPQFSQMLYRASDNYAFVEKGVVAHSFSAGSLHKDYHQPGDEWQKLELKHMTRVIQGLFIGSLPLAQGTVTPQATAQTRRN